MLHSSLPSRLRVASGLLGLYNTVYTSWVSWRWVHQCMNRNESSKSWCCYWPTLQEEWSLCESLLQSPSLWSCSQLCHHPLTAFSSFMCLCFDNQSLSILIITCWSWTLGVPAVCRIKGVDLESCQTHGWHVSVDVTWRGGRKRRQARKENTSGLIVKRSQTKSDACTENMWFRLWKWILNARESILNEVFWYW